MSFHTSHSFSEQEEKDEPVMEINDEMNVDMGEEVDMGDDVVVMEEEEQQQEGSETSDESAPVIVNDDVKDTVTPISEDSDQHEEEEEEEVTVTKVSAQKDLKVAPKEKPTNGQVVGFNKRTGKEEVIISESTGDSHLDKIFELGLASTIVEESSSSESERESTKENGRHKKERSKKDSKKKDKKDKKSKKEKKPTNGKSSSEKKSSSSRSRKSQQQQQQQAEQQEEAEQEQPKGGKKRKQTTESVQQTTDQGEDHIKYDPLVLVSKRPKFKKRGSFTKDMIKEKAWELTRVVCEKLATEGAKDPESYETFDFMDLIKDCKTKDEKNRVIANAVFDFVSWAEVIPPKYFNKVFAMPYSFNADPNEPSNFTQSQSFKNYTKLTYTLMAYDKEADLKHHDKLKEEKVEPKEQKKPDLSNW